MSKPDQVIISRDINKKWRWKRMACNGKVIGASAQGYVVKDECIANFRRQFDEQFELVVQETERY